MQSKAQTPEAYLQELPESRLEPMRELRKLILENLPKGFSEVMSYGMIGYVVPHSLYPAGYHCDRKQPLPFLSIASQKNYIVLYHMGIYGDKDILNWFLNEYSKKISSKPDMGKGCIRFKKMDQIPYKLVGELAAKITPHQWIEIYEKEIRK
jgi:hypothetical protein